MFRDLLIKIRGLIDGALEKDKAERNRVIETETVGEEEKSCMTPKDCEECGNGCSLCTATHPSTVKVTIPEAVDLEDCNGCTQKPSKETIDNTKRSELTNKYDRICNVCNLIAVHKHSSSGVCPDCAAEIRTRIEKKRQEMHLFDEALYDESVKELKAEKGN